MNITQLISTLAESGLTDIELNDTEDPKLLRLVARSPAVVSVDVAIGAFQAETIRSSDSLACINYELSTERPNQ